jgi:diadenosine tetraphosphate (Ap4A) HIT family hydrolase
MSTHRQSDCPFCGILNGTEPGKIIARDDERQFAIIQSIHPESVVHWLAVPYEHVDSTEEFERSQSKRFSQLFEFAVANAKVAAADYPFLDRGFTLKTHIGSFETVPHAKIHILAVE